MYSGRSITIAVTPSWYTSAEVNDTFSQQLTYKYPENKTANVILFLSLFIAIISGFIMIMMVINIYFKKERENIIK